MLNDNNFKENLKGLQVLEVSGEGCANCLSLMPMLYRVCSNRDDVSLVHFELDENSKKFIAEYDIDRVPTVLLLDDGKEIARVMGFQPEEVFEIWLDVKISEYKASKNK